MMKLSCTLLLILISAPLAAEGLVATKNIRANTILTAQDVALNTKHPGGGMIDPDDVIGLETRVVLYKGRVIHRSDLREPAVIERNQLVPLIFQVGGLQISTVGRALGRAAVGELVQVMNLSSRVPLYGHVQIDGSISVSKGP